MLFWKLSILLHFVDFSFFCLLSGNNMVERGMLKAIYCSIDEFVITHLYSSIGDDKMAIDSGCMVHRTKF
jgi:uncharacterized membrane protein